MNLTPAETAYADQRAAAAADAKTVMGRLIAPLQGSIIRPAVVPPWLQAAIDGHNALFAAGEGWGCDHVAAPGVYFAAVWNVGLVVCQDCANDNALAPATEREAWTCDACGDYKVGELAVSASNLGSLILFYGLCRSCAGALAASGQAVTDQ